MEMMGIPEKTLGEKQGAYRPAAVCCCVPIHSHVLPLGFSPPQTPAQVLVLACPSCPWAILALVPTSTPRTRAWFPLLSSPPEK